MSLLRLGYRRHGSFCVGYTLSRTSLTVGAANCHILMVLTQPVEGPTQ